MDLIKDFYFSSFILSIIVLVDLLIKFKRPILLKFYLSLLVCVIGAGSFFRYLETPDSFFLFYYAIFKAIAVNCILNIFAILYFPKTLKWVYVYTGLTLISVIYFLYLKGHLPDELNTLNKKTLFIITNWGIPLPFMFYLLRFLLVSSFMSFLFYYCYSIIKRYQFNNIYFDKIKKWTRFFMILSFLLLILFMPLSVYKDYPSISHYSNIIIFTYLLLLIYYRPNFLNRSALKISFGGSFNRDTEYAISELEFINEFYTKLYFTRNDASLDNLAKILKISSNDLYKFIYNKYTMTFNDLVNKNRVDYFIDIIHDPKFLNFTIDALAKEAGFSSRQHLYKPFKKFHGGNPSDIVDAVAV